MTVIGGSGTGKSILLKQIVGLVKPDSGEIWVGGQRAHIATPRDARALGIEALYQTLALADNLHAAANLFLGRELLTRLGLLDDASMKQIARRVLEQLHPDFPSVNRPVRTLSGGERQCVAIARAIHFNARVLIMDEPTAALGPQETREVVERVHRLKAAGIGILLVSHDLHDVLDLADRVTVMKNGRLVGTVRTRDVTPDDVLGMIIGGRLPV